MTTDRRCGTSRAFVLGLALLASDRPAAAEEAKALVPGSRVRIRTAQDRFVGRLVALQGETIVLARAEGETLGIRRADVLGLEVSQRPSRRGRGARLGALVGLGAAVAIGVAGGDDCGVTPGPATWGNFTETLNSNLCFSRTETGFLSGILTVPVGALLGALIAPGEKWRPVGGAELAVQAGASREGGLTVQVTVGF
jgi:hypothetical protein